MNKKLIVVGAALALSLTAKAVSFGGVSAYTSLSSALAAAQQQEKMLFIMTGTSWCPHCTDLKNALATLASEVNANFIVYYCDADRDKSMPSAAGFPHWGIYNPYTFVAQKRWSNKDEYYEKIGFSKLETLSSALEGAVSEWASASKTPTEGGTEVVPPQDPGSSSDSGTSTRDRKKTTESAAQLVFYIDAEDLMSFPETIKGNTVLTDFLPTLERPEEAELTSKLKMTVEKAAKITYNRRKGLTVDTKKGDNYSSLKLTYNKTKKTFKGSFKIYTQKSSGSLKKVTVKVTDGTYKDGVGSATATVSGTKLKWTVHLVAVED